MLERLVTLCLLLKRLKTGRGKIEVVCCSLPLFFLRLDNGKYADLRFECVCLKYRKCCGAQGGKRGGKTSGEVDTQNARLFTRGLEHFVKYYVFTK